MDYATRNENIKDSIMDLLEENMNRVKKAMDKDSKRLLSSNEVVCFKLLIRLYDERLALSKTMAYKERQAKTQPTSTKTPNPPSKSTKVAKKQAIDPNIAQKALSQILTS